MNTERRTLPENAAEQGVMIGAKLALAS